MSQKMKEARSNPNTGPRSGMGATRDKLRKELQVAIIRILTPEQQKQYKEMSEQAQEKRGTLWQMDDQGALIPIQVVLGSNDTSYTEISGRGLKEGIQVIYGTDK